MQVHQINIQYNALQDRILLRISFREGGEQTAWLTRRLCIKLLPQLVQTVSDFVAQLQAAQGTGASAVALADTDTRQLLSDLRRSASNEKANFTKPYAAASGDPQDALLVYTVNIYSRPDKGQFAIELLDKPQQTGGTQRRLKWSMDESTLHASTKLLEDAVAASGWNLAATSETPPARQDGEALHTLERPKYLN